MKKLERTIGKASKHTPSCCVYVSSTSYKNKNKRIYRVSIKILGFPTPFSNKQAWKCNLKHNFVSFSLKTHFSLKHFIGPNGDNLNPFKLLLDVLFCIKGKNVLHLAF